MKMTDKCGMGPMQFPCRQAFAQEKGILSSENENKLFCWFHSQILWLEYAGIIHNILIILLYQLYPKISVVMGTIDNWHKYYIPYCWWSPTSCSQVDAETFRRYVPCMPCWLVVGWTFWLDPWGYLRETVWGYPKHGYPSLKYGSITVGDIWFPSLFQRISWGILKLNTFG